MKEEVGGSCQGQGGEVGSFGKQAKALKKFRARSRTRTRTRIGVFSTASVVVCSCPFWIAVERKCENIPFRKRVNVEFLAFTRSCRSPL